jgi:U3 small nucleolar ribonucleoprotein protein IMP4
VLSIKRDGGPSRSKKKCHGRQRRATVKISTTYNRQNDCKQGGSDDLSPPLIPFPPQRKQTRERRDYLYRRALLLRDAEISEKRARLKAALATGKPLDPELARDVQLRKDLQYDESRPDMTAAEAMDVDDEYAELSGIVDPRVLVTTSRNPSSRLAAFSKEFRLLLPTAVRLNRGTLVLPDLVSSAQKAGLTDVCLLHEHRGTPTALTVSHMPHGPTISFSLHNVVLRHDIPGSMRGTVSEAYPHLIFDGFTTRLGERVVKILKHIFPPRDALTSKHKLGNRVVTFKNFEDNIEVRHHVFVRTGHDSVELAEVGPRMTMRVFEVRGGTLENKHGDVEWHLSQYTRTGRKKTYL